MRLVKLRLLLFAHKQLLLSGDGGAEGTEEFVDAFVRAENCQFQSK
jgi:hypothetical protein